MNPKLSVIITAKNFQDPKLWDLLDSMDKQTFRDFEIDVVTEGNSESAKAIGVKRAAGEIICILASDNYLNDPEFFEKCLKPFETQKVTGAFPIRYFYDRKDNILNRYFALFGVNDPVPLYLHKNDRQTYYDDEIFGYPTFLGYKNHFIAKLDKIPTMGDNGFFIRKDRLMEADIDHYYHIDVCQDLFEKGYNRYGVVSTSIWHKTGNNFLKFFWKRFRYADQYANNRRWKMVTKKDLPRLIFFILSTLTLIYPLYLSIKGYRIVKDKAWFLHLPVCLITTGVYGAWTLKRLMNYILGLRKNI